MLEQPPGCEFFSFSDNLFSFGETDHRMHTQVVRITIKWFEQKLFNLLWGTIFNLNFFLSQTTEIFQYRKGPTDLSKARLTYVNFSSLTNWNSLFTFWSRYKNFFLSHISFCCWVIVFADRKPEMYQLGDLMNAQTKILFMSLIFLNFTNLGLKFVYLHLYRIYRYKSLLFQLPMVTKHKQSPFHSTTFIDINNCLNWNDYN